MRPMNFGPGAGKDLAEHSQKKAASLTDDEILLLASKVQSSPVDPIWLKGHVKVTSIHDRALTFARAVLAAAEAKLKRQG